MTTHKQIEEAADRVCDALTKLTTGLAKDGVAIDGFTDALKAVEDYKRLKLKRSFELWLNRMDLRNIRSQ
jgi:hypothetical protein